MYITSERREGHEALLVTVATSEVSNNETIPDWHKTRYLTRLKGSGSQGFAALFTWCWSNHSTDGCIVTFWLTK